MRQPDIYSATVIKHWPNEQQLPNGVWVPARPMGHNAFSWMWRWGLALKVLLGIYDALHWEEPK